MGAIQSLMNVIFFLAVAATVGGSVWLSRKYKERYAEFPWGKAALVIAIEVASWIIFNWLWTWVRMNPWIAAVVVIVVVIILFKRKKKEDQIL
jgi:CHASE2 domain-containing sensor protein